MTSSPASLAVSARLALAGRDVVRVGFGAARLTAGDGWGRPVDPERSRALVRAARDAGVDYFDTADALGPGVSETIIGETLGDADDVLVATKVGMLRAGPRTWDVLGHPNYLRQQVYSSLVRLRRERIDLLYLHRIDPAYPLADQLGALQDLRDQGLIARLGVSEPTAAQLDEVLALEPRLAAVQSLYNLVARDNAVIARTLGERGIPFVAYWPLIGRGLSHERHARLFAALAPIAADLDVSTAELALAWIFTTLPNGLAVVGSRSTRHLAGNVAASGVRLPVDALARIDDVVARELAGVRFDPSEPREDA